MLFSISFYTYTAVCKYLFVFLYILSLFVYIFFNILDYAPGGGQIHFQPEFCLPAAFCAIPKRLSTRLPFDIWWQRWDGRSTVGGCVRNACGREGEGAPSTR